MSYNVHNFFDAEYTGVEYPEFSAENWTRADYETKLKNIGEALKNISPSVNLLILSEIEYQAAQDLQKYYLPWLDKVYSYTHEGLGISILTNLLIKEVKTHDFSIKSYRLRPIVELRINTTLSATIDISVLAVHIKSKRGKNTEEIKRVQQYQMNSLIELLKRRKIYVLAGDFNDTDHSQTLFSAISTIKPFDCYATIECTSYLYQNKWLHLDGIYLSTSFDSYILSSEIKALRYPPYSSSNGAPASHFRVPFKYSLSDHFPLQLTIQY